MRIHIGIDFLEGGVLITRLSVLILLVWPVLATLLSAPLFAPLAVVVAIYWSRRA